MYGHVANDGDLRASRQRQQRFLVIYRLIAQQHYRFPRDVQCSQLAVFAMFERLGLVDALVKAVADQRSQVAADLVVNHVLMQLTIPDIRQQLGFGKLEPARHVDIGACPGALEGVLNGVEIAHDVALEAPLAFKNVGNEMMIFTRVLAVDLVVAAHDRSNIGVLDQRFEAGQIQLLHRAFVDLHIQIVPIRFLLVHQVMLGRSLHALHLNAIGYRRRQNRAEERILTTHVLG
ncbi:hypothetical protein ALP75_201252 [Pseudomonas syringae pv. actinidiae]|nr:hypothetical protein ALP75_201252 [Pseudomonas syringae pv. actinidiae]